MRFKPGQEVVCIDDEWSNTSPNQKHPKKGDLVTVDHYDFYGVYICLVGFDHSWYLEDCFEELPSMEEINEALQSEPAHV